MCWHLDRRGHSAGRGLVRLLSTPLQPTNGARYNSSLKSKGAFRLTLGILIFGQCCYSAGLILLLVFCCFY